MNIHPGSAKNKMKNALLMAIEFMNMMPPAETPAHTEGYEGFYHLHAMKGDETEAELHFIIRDHDREKFEERKQYLGRVAAYLEGKYGKGSVELYLKDSYYNMREQIEPHMYLILRARAAMEKAGGHAPGGAHPGRHRRRTAELHGPALSQPVHRRRQLPRRTRVHPRGEPGEDGGGARQPGDGGGVRDNRINTKKRPDPDGVRPLVVL